MHGNSLATATARVAQLSHKVLASLLLQAYPR